MRYQLVFFILIVSCVLNAQTKNLDDYINAVLKNSPELKDYSGQIQQNKIDSTLIISDYKPQVNFDGQALAAPTYGKFGYDEAVTNGGSYEAIVSVSQVITPRKEIDTHRKLSNIEHQSLSNHAKQAELQLKKDVGDKFLNICLLQQQQRFLLQSDSFLTRELIIVKNLTEKSIYKVSDYYELLTEEQTEHSEVAQVKIEILQSFSDLNETCGIKDTSTYKLIIPSIQTTLQNDVHQLNEFKKFQTDSMQIYFQQELFKTKYNPRLSWYADAGIEASQPNLIYRSIGNSLGLNLSIPLYDGHKKELNIRSLKISDNIRVNYEDFFVEKHNTYTVYLASQINETNKLIVQLKKEQEQTDKWKEVSELQLSAGNISVTDFLLSIRKELEVKNEITQAMINKQLLQNEFNFRNQ